MSIEQVNMNYFLKNILSQAGRLDIWKLEGLLPLSSLSLCDTKALLPVKNNSKTGPSSAHCVSNLSCQCTLSFVKQRTLCVKKQKQQNMWGRNIQLMTKYIINTTQSKRFSRRRACWYDHQNNVMWQIVSKLLLVFSIAPIDDWSLFKETRMWQAPHAMDGGNE